MKSQPFTAIFCMIAGFSLIPTSAQATLIGLSPFLPTIDFSGSGNISYQANSGVVSINANPSTLFSSNPFIVSEIQNTLDNTPRALSIQFQVDNFGNLIQNNTLTPSLTLIGSVDLDGDNIADHSGILLTANATQFGFLDNPEGDDKFDLSLNAIGGSLAYLYAGQNLASLVISEASHAYTNSFNGSFNADWQAQATGIIGLLPLEPSAPVPVPPAFWLWTGALASLFPGLKRIRHYKT
jgi:hypothetical protein